MGLFSSKKQTIPASGFYTMPSGYQTLYNNVLGSANNLFFNGESLDPSAFTPLAQTDDETRAFELIREGLAPTPESLSSDLSMFMNPFDQYVVDDLNRQSQGNYSLAKQAGESAGQMGSNRDFLAASDVEQQRLNSIGQFRQSQYNQALDSVLGPLAGLRQQDIQNLSGIGEFQRSLDYVTRQAPVNALNAAQGVLVNQPTSFGNFGSPETTVKSGGGFGGLLSAVAPIVGSALGGPIGGMIGGAVGGAAGGGGLEGAISGAVGSAVSGGSFPNFSNMGQTGGFSPGGFLGGLSQGNSMEQMLGSLASKSPVGPYQPISASRFR